MSWSTALADSASAVGRWLGLDQSELIKILCLRLERAIGRERDLLDLRLGLVELGLAMALQRGPAGVGADRVGQPAAAGLELAHDRLQLLERFLEAQAGDLGQ